MTLDVVQAAGMAPTDADDFTKNCLTILVISLLQTQFSVNNSRRNLYQKLTNISPSNIFPIYDCFPSYFQISYRS